MTQTHEDRLLSMPLEMVEQKLFAAFGRQGGYSANSEYDMSDYNVGVSSQTMPEWRKAIHKAYHGQTDPKMSNRKRLFQAIRLAADQGADVPANVKNAKMCSDCVNFKNEEIKFYEAESRRRFSGIDEGAVYDLNAFAHAIVVGRFDIAAKMYCAATTTKRRRWLKRNWLRHALSN